MGTAWGMGTHFALYGGVPHEVRPPEGAQIPDFTSFYRWHVLDPVMFEDSVRVTIQQIGAMAFLKGQEAQLAEYEKTNPVAGEGWLRNVHPALLAWGIAERVDDYCATAYVYCLQAQPVPRLDVDAALADIARMDFEQPLPQEQLSAVVDPSTA